MTYMDNNLTVLHINNTNTSCKAAPVFDILLLKNNIYIKCGFFIVILFFPIIMLVCRIDISMAEIRNLSHFVIRKEYNPFQWLKYIPDKGVINKDAFHYSIIIMIFNLFTDTH